MIEKEIIHLLEHLLSVFCLCISSGCNGAFIAVKVAIDLRTGNNWPGRFTSYG